MVCKSSTRQGQVQSDFLGRVKNKSKRRKEAVAVARKTDREQDRANGAKPAIYLLYSAMTFSILSENLLHQINIAIASFAYQRIYGVLGFWGFGVRLG